GPPAPRVPGTGFVPLRSPAAVARTDSPRGLREPWGGGDPRPARQRALALRPRVGLGRTQPSVPSDHAPERRHRDQRRLQRPGGDRRPEAATHRLAVRPPRPARTGRRLSPHPRWNGLRPARTAREAALAVRAPPIAREHMFA